MNQAASDAVLNLAADICGPLADLDVQNQMLCLQPAVMEASHHDVLEASCLACIMGRAGQGQVDFDGTFERSNKDVTAGPAWPGGWLCSLSCS